MLSITPPDLNKLIWKIFTRGRGLTLTTDAVECIINSVVDVPIDEMHTILDYIATTYSSLPNVSVLVGKSDIEPVLVNIGKNMQAQHGTLDTRQYTHVMDAFSQIPWEYKNHKKSFEKVERKLSLFGTASDKIGMFVQRYEFTRQRTIGFDQYASHSSQKDYIELCTIKRLKGLQNAQMIHAFGMLSQLEEGRFFLEDPEDNILLDLSDAKTSNGIFCEGCMVIAEGCLIDDIFKVSKLRMPPVENRAKTCSLQSYPDILQSSKIDESREVLTSLESRLDDPTIIIMSEVYLDEHRTTTRLDKLFKSFTEDTAPNVMILCGTFLSKPSPNGSRSFDSYKSRFAMLAKIISKHQPLVKKCKFILCPSASDSFSSDSLPQRSMPSQLLSQFTHHNIDAVFGSNPCRITFFTHEIVVFRDNFTNRFLHNAIIPPDSTESAMHIQAVQTILGQAHLNPLALSLNKTIWGYDHSLHLTPLPNLLICAEKLPAYVLNHTGTVTVNPGPFSISSFIYAKYWPKSGRIEACSAD